MEPNLSRIGQVALTVSDVAAALAFYGDVLGLPVLARPDPDLAFLAAGDVRIMLTTPRGAGAVGANSILYFHAAEITQVYASLVARGASPEREPQVAARMPDHVLWLAFVRDPDGNLIGLMEERR